MPSHPNESRDHHGPPSSQGALKSLQIVMILVAIAAGRAFGFGVFPDVIASPGTANWVLPPLIAIVLAGGLAVCWHYILALAAHTEDPNKKIAAVVLALALTAVGMSSTSWFLVEKLEGRTALAESQMAFLNEVRRAEEAISQAAESDFALLAALETGAAKLQSAASGEGERGDLSGRAGFKKVFQDLQDGATAFMKIAATVSEVIKDRRDRLADARQAIADARRAIAAKNSKDFQEAAGRTTAALDDASRIKVSSLISGLGIGLEANAASAKIRTAIDDVEKVAHGIDAKSEPAMVPVYFPMTTREAVIKFPPVLGWLMATIIEAMGLIGVIILLVIPRKPPDAPDVSEAPNVVGFPHAPHRSPYPAE